MALHLPSQNGKPAERNFVPPATISLGAHVTLSNAFINQARLQKNVEALKAGALIGTFAVPAFWLLDWVMAPAHVWTFLWLRLASASYAAVQIAIIRYRRDIAEKYVVSLGLTGAFSVGAAISVMAWIHDGYESPYYAGLCLTVMVASWLYVWNAKVTLAFDLALYGFYMLPAALGLIHVKQTSLVINNQFFLISTTFIAWFSWAYTYRNEEQQLAIQYTLEETKQSLENANLRLQELDLIKNQFFANVSHELRTPLTLALGPVDNLLSTERHGERKNQLQMVQRNQLRLLALINDLLEFSKLEAGKVTINWEVIDVGRELRVLSEPFENAAKLTGIDFQQTYPESPLWIRADRNKFDKIVANLLSNALKFTARGGRIALRVQLAATDVVIQVSDTGIGIPLDKHEVIFERFSQVDNSMTRQHTGTGIGLALVKEYSELLGGSVDVQSEVGKGSQFILRFHRAEPSAQALATHDREAAVLKRQLSITALDAARVDVDPEEQTPVVADVAPESEPPRLSADTLQAIETLSQHTAQPSILVVEDTRDMRVYIEGLLKSEYKVMSARDGVEGFALAQALKPDVIISDVMMPKMSGEELCRLVKAQPGWLGHTPVLLVTARVDAEGKLRGLEGGADDYLFKPFNAAELLLKVRNLVRIRKQDRGLWLAHHALEQRELEHEADLKMARAFQHSLLPPASGVDFLKVRAHYQPVAQVGGDYYDVHRLSPEKMRLFLADATDHGVQAALRTMMIKAEYDTLKTKLDSPAEVLTALNQAVVEHYPAERASYVASSVRFSAICLDFERRASGVVHATLSGGGHESPRHVEDSRAKEIFVAGVTLGTLPMFTYTQTSFELRPRERLYLYSDGLVEQRNAQGAQFGELVLEVALREAAQEPSLELALKTLLARWNNFRADTSVSDDLTIVVVEI